MFIIIAVLFLISGTVMNPGPCSTSDESGTQSDISIESENTLLHDLNIWINNKVCFKSDMKTNVMIKLVPHNKEEEILYTYNRGW